MTRFVAIPALALIACLVASAGDAAPRRGAQPSRASAPPPATGPDYVGVFEARVNGAPMALERQPIQSRVKSGFTKGKITEEVAGERSPVRVASGQPLQFVVRVTSQEIDPQTIIDFYRLTPGKRRRALLTTKIGFGSFKGAADRQAVAFEAQRHGARWFLIRPLGPLPAGEYMLRLTPQQVGFAYQPGDGFLFGVD